MNHSLFKKFAAKARGDLLDGRVPSANPQAEVYQMLLVAVCNYYWELMPARWDYDSVTHRDECPKDLKRMTPITTTLKKGVFYPISGILWPHNSYYTRNYLKRNKVP